MNSHRRGILIGIAGGSGSGKSLVARTIYDQLGHDEVIIIEQDAYYRDLSHLTFEERAAQNFDHPDAIDIELMRNQIQLLLHGETVQQPIYDFGRHLRSKMTRRIGPHHIIILEGILILYYPEIRSLMNIKVFVDTDSDIRVIRRLQRDICERERTMESVIHRYQDTVRSMHLEFVEPSKRYSDIIIPEGGMNLVAVDLLKTKIQALLSDR